MMREIKFRAWNTVTNHWHKTELPFYGFHLFGECTLVCPPRLDDLQNLIIEQFVGIQDKTGKDVFEGDVVIWPHLDSEGYHEIYFHEKELQYSARPLTIHDEIDSCIDSTHMKVVGNIHQNPELLKS